jgi:hypothetical protein
MLRLLREESSGVFREPEIRGVDRELLRFQLKAHGVCSVKTLSSKQKVDSFHFSSSAGVINHICTIFFFFFFVLL